MTLVLVQSDTAPDITAVLHAEGDSSDVIDLTGASVKFQLRREHDKHYRINTACTVTDATAGEVSYTFTSGDLDVPGEYIAQFEITFLSGRIQTTATPIPVTIRPQ